MKLSSVLTAASAIALALPAHAAIVGVTPNAALSLNSPYTVKVSPTASYSFQLTGDSFNTIAVSVGGDAQIFSNGPVSNNQAAPLQLGAVVPDQLSLGEFFQPNGAATIPYSIALVNVALRFVDGSNTYYGYAQVAGDSLLALAYNDTPGGSISTGDKITGTPTLSVPEPAAWAMMIGGFGLVGAAMRRRYATNVRVA